MDYVALPVIMGLAKVPALRRAATGFTRWSLGHLASYDPPNKLVVRLEASGLRAGRPATARLEISGDDGYLLTAAPVVAGLRRVLDGGWRRSGLWLQAQLADPDDLLTQLVEAGLRVDAEVAPDIA